MNKEIENFCKNVKHIRKINNLSKKKMAQYCGISVYSLNKIEQGVLPPNLSYQMLFHLNKNFGVTPSRIFQ